MGTTDSPRNIVQLPAEQLVDLERYPVTGADESLGALNLAVMGPGDELWWHFDQTDFVVSIALQDAEAGGDFEYVPLIRGVDDERYDEVARVLGGASEDAIGVPMEAGTLMLF